MLSWAGKFKNIFTSGKSFTDGLKSIFSNKKIDEALLSQFRDILISADFGVETSKKIIDSIKNSKLPQDNIEIGLKELIEQNIKDILMPAEKPLDLTQNQLNIILLAGVNGSGKTTTIGKLAAKYISQGMKVKIAACDTFRAAASEQIKIWSDRVGAEIVTQLDNKGDPASVAYRAITKSLEDSTDILFIDSAGRLQNNKNLMDELAKIVRVTNKLGDGLPKHFILVLDGSSGQNTISQFEQFSKVAPITGIIVTKLDGTAKAGTIVNLTEKFKTPIHFIGVGESLSDLKEFNVDEYVQSLFT